jgi:hypothetical protein
MTRNENVARFAAGIVVAALFLAALLGNACLAVTIPLGNPNFDDTSDLTSSLPGNNQFDFVTPAYDGWREFLVATGVPHNGLAGNNVGPINTTPSDITVETTSGTIALYHQNALYRVDQTTSHILSAADASFSLGVDVGRDSSGGFAGYHISLYADNGAGVKTTIKSISSSVDGGNPAINSYLHKTLNLTQADFLPYAGQQIGISLQAESSARPVFYDTVTLDFVAAPLPAPEPSALAIMCPLGLLLVARRKKLSGATRR